MKIIVKTRPYPFVSRLIYTLGFILDSCREITSWQWMEDNNASGVQFYLDGTKRIDLPMDGEWLNHREIKHKPNSGKWLEMDSDWWFRFFFFLSLSDRSFHPEYDEKGRWIAPPPDDFWPDRSRPFLDQATEYLWSLLNRDHFNAPWTRKGSFSPVLSVDVDQWYAFQSKNWKRKLGGTMRDLIRGRWDRIKLRYGVWVQKKQDPYDTLTWMQEQAEKYGVGFEVFVLPEARSDYDKQVSIGREALKEKLNSINQVGLHPSYYVHEKPDLLEEQKRKMESSLGGPLEMLRYHYLRGRYPESQLLALQNGFSADKTLALVGQYGFPSGTCQIYPFWNPLENKSTPLMLHPQLTMDVNLKDYLKWPAEEICLRLTPHINEIKKHKGLASIIWHNSSFDETEGWKGYTQTFTDLLEVLGDRSIR